MQTSARELAGIAASLGVLIAAIAAAGIVYHPDLRVAMGDSMEPTITGPAVVHCPASNVTATDIETGDIVTIQRTFDGDPTGSPIMHRVTGIKQGDHINPEGYVTTKGDGNSKSDGIAKISNIECVYSSHVELPV